MVRFQCLSTFRFFSAKKKLRQSLFPYLIPFEISIFHILPFIVEMYKQEKAIWALYSDGLILKYSRYAFRTYSLNFTQLNFVKDWQSVHWSIEGLFSCVPTWIWLKAQYSPVSQWFLQESTVHLMLWFLLLLSIITS